MQQQYKEFKIMIRADWFYIDECMHCQVKWRGNRQASYKPEQKNRQNH